MFRSPGSNGRLEVDARVADQALNTIRSQYRLRQPRSGVQWWLRRVLVPAGMAAATIILLGWMAWSVRPATAAERLRDAGKATTDYRGWLHQTSRIKEPSGTDSPVEADVHCNTETGDWVDVLRFKDRWPATMRSPQKRQQAVYRSEVNTLTIASVDQETAQRWAKSAHEAPWTVDAALDAAKVFGVEKELVVNERKDGDMNRFDITFPKDDPAAAQAQHRSELLLQATVWSDPQTKLIRRWDITDREVHSAGKISYGEPEIKDLYDVGVPRTALVLKRAPATRSSP